jgi:predicted tellurium resistance membrane protein TerC
VLSTAVNDLKYLDKAVGLVLAVIAAKLVGEVNNIELLSPVQSLAVVLSILGAGVGASLIWKDSDDASDATHTAVISTKSSSSSSTSSTKK